uniref:Uncharacterized protein n=1 Tax=Melanopsichium pennsylvanicum 4 TaxID=1398559 RepID=A0A077R2Q4_9BASI|nr:uncharacterized protein BN887_06100 [Melanopsichium pennsylvanicum 4]
MSSYPQIQFYEYSLHDHHQTNPSRSSHPPSPYYWRKKREWITESDTIADYLFPQHPHRKLGQTSPKDILATDAKENEVRHDDVDKLYAKAMEPFAEFAQTGETFEAGLKMVGGPLNQA